LDGSRKLVAMFFLVLVSSLVANPASQWAFSGQIDWLNAFSLSFTLAVVLTVFTWYKRFYGKNAGKGAGKAGALKKGKK